MRHQRISLQLRRFGFQRMVPFFKQFNISLHKSSNLILKNES